MALNWHLRPILLFLVTTHVFSLSESEALIKLKSSFDNAAALSSWVPGSTPCGQDAYWTGLICSRGNVTGLQLENMGLSGQIDVDALLGLSQLRTLSFSHNSFSGNIPEINRLGYLRGIFLSGNQFSGEIPADFFSKMSSLKKVRLSDNQFIGSIPTSLSDLSNLIELYLENNGFTGTIPTMKHTSLQRFNVSNNQLEGAIPPGFQKFDASSFEGNADLCGDKVGKICNKNLTRKAATPVPSSGNEDDGSFATKATAGFIALAILVIVLAGAILVRLRRRKNSRSDDEEPGEVEVSMPTRHVEVDITRKPGGSGKKTANSNKGGLGDLALMNDEKGTFKLTDLMKASAEVLGNGGLGSSYKAVMGNSVAVVVKRMREMNSVGKDAFDTEVRKLGGLRHPNILAPLAYHFRKDEKLFIYDYKPNGSLLYLLHGDHGTSHIELNWPARLKIIKGIAKGLDCIHTALSDSDLPHGNLKASNILMDSDNEPLLSEFGFRPLINPAMAGEALFAFHAPEAEHMVSPKCDVFCLGIIILEILTGKYPSVYVSNGDGGIDLIEWVKTGFLEGQEQELLDPETTNSTNSVGEMIKLLHIGLACTNMNPDLRPDMKEVVLSIEEIKLENGSDYKPSAVPDLGSPSLRYGFPGNQGHNMSVGNESELSGRGESERYSSDRIQHLESDHSASPGSRSEEIRPLEKQ